MPLPANAPAWAAQLALAYESGAHGQFILYGNVHDRLPQRGRLVGLTRYLEEELLTGFDVVFAYDLGNGLQIQRGGERLRERPGACRRCRATPCPPWSSSAAICATWATCAPWGAPAMRRWPASCAAPINCCPPRAAAITRSAAWRAW